LLNRPEPIDVLSQAPIPRLPDRAGASCVSLAIFAALIGFTSYFTERYALAKTEKELTQQVQGSFTCST
jgi:hypothetical protein